jgi:hypothetical protein
MGMGMGWTLSLGSKSGNGLVHANLPQMARLIGLAFQNSFL